MATYEMFARTNYFKVRDEAKFKEWLEIIGADSHQTEKEGEKVHCLTFENGMPLFIESLDKDIDFMSELSEHLADGWVAIYMEAGHEAQRYVEGYAIAINSKGETIHISIESIYDLAKELGTHITKAEY